MIQRSPTGCGQAPLVPVAIKRSRSVGSAVDLVTSNGGGLLVQSGDPSVVTNSANNAITDMAPFPDDVTAKLKQVSPNMTSKLP